MAFLLASFLRCQTILFASCSLFHGVADLRAARGDAPGAARARSIARAIEGASGLGLFWGVATNPGEWMEAMEAIRDEVVGGDLVKDLLLMGGNGLNGLIQVLKDIASSCG